MRGQATFSTGPRFWTGLVALVTLVAIGAPPVAAQNFELTPYVGYVWGGSFSDISAGFDDIQLTDFSVSDSSSWGLFADFSLTENWQIEAIYNRQETDIRVSGGFLEPGTRISDMDMEYFQIGMLYQWQLAGARPYLSGGLGGARFNPAESDTSAETRFAINLGGGVKVFFGEHIGFRADLRWYSTYISDKDELFCDPFFGCYRTNVGEYMNQFQAAGGLILAF